MKIDIYWIWLSRIKHIGPVWQKKLINEFQSPKAVYEACEDELLEMPGMTKKIQQSIITSRSLKDAETILKKAEKSRVNLLFFDNECYPHFAKACKESPIVLYYRGELKPLETTVGVVGARRCSPYGKKVAEQIGKELAALDISVISGFAKGIDSYAQAACTVRGGYTLGFLGCGPDICYPPEQSQLYHKILENGGAFLSQFPPGITPNPKYFLSRNALISAWSTELVIVEASEQSGALWTADFAVKNNKPVYVVPNQIGIREGVGTNLLLSRGYQPFLGIDSLKSIKGKVENQTPEYGKSENPILQILSHSPTTVQQISIKLNLVEEEVMDLLFDLEINNEIIMKGNVVFKL